MIVHPSACVLILVLFSQFSTPHPVPDAGEKISKTVQQKPVYQSPAKEGGETDHPRPVRHDPEEGMEGEQQLESLRPEAVDTIRKINPLTIANQVSYMMRKQSQKNAAAAKPSVADRRGCIREEDPAADPSSAVAANSEEIRSVPGYIRPEPPKIVNKPKPNDFGYSVIVVAGDPVNLPITVQETSGKNLKQTVYKGMTAEEQIRSKEKSSNNEIRVAKEYSVNPDFPVYDNDFNFIPDPFNGILEENYWKDQSKNEHQRTNLSGEDAEQEATGSQVHNVQVRSSGEVEHSNIIDEKMSCGTSYGKSNFTGTFTK